MFCLLNSLSNSHLNKLRLQLREFSIYYFIPPRLVQICEIHIFISVNPLLSPHPSQISLILAPLNDRLYYSITTVKHRVDWSGMVCSPTGSSYLFLIFGWMTSTFMSLRFSTLHSSFFGELISSSVLSKWNMLPLSNKPPVSIKPPRPPPQIGLK